MANYTTLRIELPADDPANQALARAAIGAAGLVDGKLDPDEFPDIIDARLRVLTGTDAALAEEVLLAGEIACPTDATGLRKGDGVTAGGELVGRLATPAEAAAGTATDRSVTPSGLLIIGELGSASAGKLVSSEAILNVASVPAGSVGAGSIQLQTIRSSSSQCASGSNAVAVGPSTTASGLASCSLGNGSIASGAGSVALVGAAASGASSTAIGTAVAASATASTAIGARVTASGVGSVALGGTTTMSGTFVPNEASGMHSFVFGRAARATAQYSIAIGGQVYSDRLGQRSFSTGRFSADGDAQSVAFIARNKTTTNSAVTLFLDGSSVRLTIPSGKVMAATVNVSGVKSDGSAMAHFIRKVSIKNVGGTTTLASISTVGTDDAAGTSLAITADDTNDALQIAVTGIVSETWRWVAHIEGVEIAYGA